MERLIAAIEELYLFSSSDHAAIGVSIGIATAALSESDAETLVAADAALYAAKAAPASACRFALTAPVPEALRAA